MFVPTRLEDDVDLAAVALRQLREAGRVSLTLFRIMIPVLVVVKVLSELGAVSVIASLFAPVMGLVGLPGELGLVWATAVVTNMYGGIVVLASMAPGLGLTTAQATVIACMVLVAHSMPVETTIARKVGVRLRFMIPFRLVSGFLLGLLLHLSYEALGVLQGPQRLLWSAEPSGGGLWEWAVSQARNMVMIFLIVLALIVLLRLLDRLGATRIIERLLAPVLGSLGIGRSATTVTVVGMVLGISYGGGLIIREVDRGRMTRRDVFSSLALMGLCHAVVEDTLLMLSLGASITGVLLGRLAFTWAVMALLTRLVARMDGETFRRLLFRPRS